MKNNNMRGITLTALVITIIILLILAGITIVALTGDNGLLTRVKEAKEKTLKADAQEILNLKISEAYTKSYVDNNGILTLQYLADFLYEDKTDIEYVTTISKTPTSEKPIVGDNDNLYVKLIKYPYEFEINQNIEIIKIDGIEIGNITKDDNDGQGGNEDKTDTSSLSQEKIEELINAKVNEKLAAYSTTAEIQNKYATKDSVGISQRYYYYEETETKTIATNKGVEIKRYTIPEDGVYIITLESYWPNFNDLNTPRYNFIHQYRNSTQIKATNDGDSGYCAGTNQCTLTTSMFNCKKGDVIIFYLSQYSGSNKSAIGGITLTKLN